MSTSYKILRFAKPKKKELKDINHFSTYDRYELNSNEEEDYCDSHEFIRLFRTDDPYAANLLHSRFAVPMILPRTEMDYDKMYRSMDFVEEDIKNKKVHLTYGNGWHFTYTDGKEKRKISIEKMKEFEYEVPTECFAIKMEVLWDSDDVYVYPDHDLVKKHIPDIDKYSYVSVNNSILAKAEIPFLIFDRYRGKCYIEKN